MPSNEEIVKMCLSGDIRSAQNVFNQQMQVRVDALLSDRRDEIATQILQPAYQTTN